MQIVSTIINFVLIVAGITGFFWSMVGVPIGIVWLIMHLFANASGNKLNKKIWAWITFGGVGVLIFVFTLYALGFIVTALFGINIFGSTVPKI